MSRETGFPVAPAFALAFDGDLDPVAALSGLLARDVLLAFGFEERNSSTDLDFGGFISFRLLL
jgi:hypothetical protein